jgi:uncharacterized membrane protein YfhO
MGELPRRGPSSGFESRRPVDETELVSYEPQKVVVRARMHRPGLLILAEQYDVNWRAEVRHISHNAEPQNPLPAYHVPILRTNRVLRGVPLPEGEWEITFVYHPLSFRLGAILSFFAWAALAMFLLGTMARKLSRSRMRR